MKSMSSVFPLVLIITGCTQHNETQVTVERITIPDSYVLQFIVSEPLAAKKTDFMVSIDLPRDKNHKTLAICLNDEAARTRHEFYGSSATDFSIELVDYRFNSTDSVSGQLNVERQYPYRAHWSMPIGFTVGTKVKRTLEAPRQNPVTIEFWLKDTPELAAYEQK